MGFGLAPPPTGAVDISCLDDIASDTTLHEDLNCAGKGLTIVADGVTLDCADHTITGTGVLHGNTIKFTD